MCERYLVPQVWCKQVVGRVAAFARVGVGAAVGFRVGVFVGVETDIETDLPDPLEQQLDAGAGSAAGCPERPSGSSAVGGDDICLPLAIGFCGFRPG